MTDNEKNSATEMTDNEIIRALEEWIKALKDDYKRLQLLDAPMDCFEESHTDNIRLLTNALDLIKHKDEQIEALIAGQETLQKYIVEKDAEIEKLNNLCQEQNV